jgi:hypothetical protein
MSVTPATERIVPLSNVDLSCVATDFDGDPLSYAWSATGGEILEEGPDVVWVAPDAEGLYRIFVAIDDGRGGTDEVSLSLAVRFNTPPEILVMQSEVTEETGWVVPEARVYVWCEVEDAEGDEVAYTWAATRGEIYGEGDAVIWVASPVLGMEWITVLVEDTYGGRAERSIPITVNMAEPPTIHDIVARALDTDLFKPYGDSWRIFKERSCTLEALMDDHESYIYEWTAERGTITADGPNAVWVAPSGPKGWVNIVLQVSDMHGNESSKSVRIYVETCTSCM